MISSLGIWGGRSLIIIFSEGVLGEVNGLLSWSSIFRDLKLIVITFVNKCCLAASGENVCCRVVFCTLVDVFV